MQDNSDAQTGSDGEPFAGGGDERSHIRYLARVVVIVASVALVVVAAAGSASRDVRSTFGLAAERTRAAGPATGDASVPTVTSFVRNVTRLDLSTEIGSTELPVTTSACVPCAEPGPHPRTFGAAVADQRREARTSPVRATPPEEGTTGVATPSQAPSVAAATGDPTKDPGPDRSHEDRRPTREDRRPTREVSVTTAPSPAADGVDRGRASAPPSSGEPADRRDNKAGKRDAKEGR